ncbi:copine-9-like [Bradysia coprophila]|uniref:copine-9-like n=1 Tax=Bradysia coprophila TaxID=38358 RepID=UPI00187D7438|nr:copine-9-like [Bradysia coprophila]
MQSVAWSVNTSSAKTVTSEMLTPFVQPKVCTTKIELSLSCNGLMNLDIASKSDPYCVLSMKERWQNEISWRQIARTETIDDCLNPQWAKKFVVDYKFETIQDMKFEIRDDDSGGKCGKYQVMGVFQTILSDIVAHSGKQFAGKLKSSLAEDCGEIVLVAEEVAACKKLVEVEFIAEKLKRQSWLKCNDPFLVISRLNEDGSYSVVKRPGTIQAPRTLMSKLSLGRPYTIWKLSIQLTSLCNGDYDRSIKIDCYNRRRNGNHRLIGTCMTSLRKIDVETLKLYKPKTSSEDCIQTGKLKIIKFQITDDVTFMDYIRNGTQMHFAVAVDFTQSNGNYTNAGSLHYLYEDSLNPYQIALQSVGEIVQNYDTSKLYPAFGFGAKIPPDGEISHQFPLNGNPKHPNCSSMEEILVHYENCVKTVELYGPTNFAPVINNAISIAREFQDGKHYFVLLMITDGIISDIKETKHAIITASSLPISIIIVGVGNANFARMDQLDSDEFRLRLDGRFAERDIVQFVPLNKFLGKRNDSTTVKSKAELAKSVLAEIPYQFVSYMEKVGYKPVLK